MTDLEWTTPAPDSTRPEREPRKRPHRHVWQSVPVRQPATTIPGATVVAYRTDNTCSRCGAVRDPAASRRGKNNRSRGNAIEVQTAHLLGTERVGHHGRPEDIETAAFRVQVKSGPAWYSIRAERELDALTPNADQVAVLVAVSTPGPGKRRRRQVRMSLGDLVRRFGEHAQAVVWFEDMKGGPDHAND